MPIAKIEIETDYEFFALMPNHPDAPDEIWQCQMKENGYGALMYYGKSTTNGDLYVMAASEAFELLTKSEAAALSGPKVILG